MYALFLFIHAVFATVFVFFDRMFETALFVFLGIVFFFAFAPFDLKKKKSSETPVLKPDGQMLRTARNRTIRFLQTGTYYLGFLFFYGSLYGIAYGLSPDPSARQNLYGITTLLLSASLLIAFFVLRKKNATVCRMFRSNSFVFSIVHLVLLISRLWGGEGFGNALFFSNVALSLFSLFSITVFDPNADSIRKNAAYSFFLGYSYFAILAALLETFPLSFPKTAITLLFIETVLVFDLFPRIARFQDFRAASAYTGIVFSYLCVLSIFAYAFVFGASAYAVSIFLAIGVFQAYVHFKYENYLSFFCVVSIAWYLYFTWFFPDVGAGFFPYLAFVYALPAAFLAVSMGPSSFGRYGRHVLATVSLLHALSFFLGYFFRFSDVSVLEISFLSLGMSAVLFSSYLSVKKPAHPH